MFVAVCASILIVFDYLFDVVNSFCRFLQFVVGFDKLFYIFDS